MSKTTPVTAKTKASAKSRKTSTEKTAVKPVVKTAAKAKPVAEVKPAAKAKPAEAGSTAGRKRVKFEIHAKPGSVVAVAGTFSKWKANDYKMEDKAGEGVFTRFVLLPKGRHEYKFIINGEWSVDPNCGEWAPNEHGTLNSIISVS